MEILRPPPTAFRALQSMAQYVLNPALCQRATVSGWTRTSISFHRDQTRRAKIQKSLSSGSILGLGCLRFQDGELLTEGKILHHQVVMSTKDSEDGCKPEANQVEHGAKVTARRPFDLVSMLLISKTDGLVTKNRVIAEAGVEIISPGLLGFVGRSMLSRLPLQRNADESRTGSGLRLEGMLHRERRSTLWC